MRVAMGVALLAVTVPLGSLPARAAVDMVGFTLRDLFEREETEAADDAGPGTPYCGTPSTPCPAGPQSGTPTEPETATRRTARATGEDPLRTRAPNWRDDRDSHRRD